jgi:hypothetical protein
MSNNAFNGAVLVLTDASNAQEIADRVAAGYFPESEYHFRITESTPKHLPEKLSNSIDAELEFAPPGSVVLTVYPFAGSSL